MDHIALKEWAVAVKAMEQGLQDVIFRKGGIQEAEGDFQLLYREFLLYPAREHQKSQYLKPEYLPLLEKVKSEQLGYTVTIQSKARVIKSTAVRSFDEALSYSGRHIWNEEFIKMRLNYKPDRPLYAIELEVEPLITPVAFLETTEYAGCRSWVQLNEQDVQQS